MAPRVYHSQLKADKLRNTLHVFSARKMAAIVTETFRSIRTPYCAVSWKFVLIITVVIITTISLLMLTLR
jgi:hypothetical protein